MKKIFLIMAIAAIATQNVTAQKATVGITGGAVFSKLSSKMEGITINSDSKIGLTFGIAGDIPLSKQVSFQPSLNYVQKGGKISIVEDPGPTLESSLRLNYIEVPLNIIYHTPGEKGHFFAGAGPSFAYGISGKEKGTDPNTGDFENKLHFGSTSDDVAKAFEIGANVLAGYQFSNGLNISVNYNHGLNNISTDGSTKDHTAYFGLRIGYMFSGKK